MVKIAVQAVVVSDGTTVDLPSEGVLLLVGPNNAGKSQFLRDIMGAVRDPVNYQDKVLSQVTLEKGNPQDFDSWMNRNVPMIVRDGVVRAQVEGWSEVTIADIQNVWNSTAADMSSLGPIASLFILHADGTSRLTAANPQGNIDFSTQLPVHPLQSAYIDPSIEDSLSTEAEKAFGTKISVDRYGGSQIMLRVGDAPVFESNGNGAPTVEYLRNRRTLPLLHEQGDGVRSYVGLLLHILAGKQHVVLVDEPEAFLHPPQARQLGRFLANGTEEKQAIIATHSASIVQGVLEAEKKTTIVRITRSGNTNHAAAIDHTALNELWADPLLRYSNLLEGLFHDAVVLCEGDADCRYFSAVIDQQPLPERRRPQVLFSHCGGKTRMATVVSALRSAKVPVVAVADIDLLRDRGDLSKLVTAMGGIFSEIETDWRVLSSAVSDDARPLRKTSLRDVVAQEIEACEDEVLTQKDVSRIRATLHAENGWDKLKRGGKSAIPQGHATRAFAALNAALLDLGILIVPVGELERFAPEVEGHGPKWITKVLELGKHRNASSEATEFTTLIMSTAENLAIK